VDRLQSRIASGDLVLETLLRTVVEVYTQMMLIDGIFHADPHPGNLLVAPNGALVLLDFGMVVRVERETRIRLIETILSAVRKDVDGVIAGFYELGLLDAEVDRGTVRDAARSLMSVAFTPDAEPRQVQRIVNEVMSTFYRWPITLPSEFVYLGRAAALAEGIALRYDPAFNAVQFASPVIRRMGATLLASVVSGPARPHAGCVGRARRHRARAARRAAARGTRRAARARTSARRDRAAAVPGRTDAPHRAVHGKRSARRRRCAPLRGGPQHLRSRGDAVRDADHVRALPDRAVAPAVAAAQGNPALPMTTSSAPREAYRALLADFDARRPAALARAVSIVENHRAGFEDLLGAVHHKLGRARRIGITGPPGAGKSTITTRLAALYRNAGLSAGIIAVDPTSPFTGGALLGDRIRMEAVALDEGIFI